MMKPLLSSLLIFCAIFFAEEKWRKVECIPAEISEKRIELSPDAKKEAKALTDYAMSFYRPDAYEKYSQQEKLEYLEECAKKIFGILEMYPESETALKSLLLIRKHPEFRERALQELTILREKAPESSNVQAAYLSTLLIAGKLDDACKVLPELLEKFPTEPLIIMQAATIYSEKNDYESLERIFELMDENPELQKEPAMRIMYLSHLYAMGDEKTADEYCDELTSDGEFLKQMPDVYGFAWQQLAKANAWSALTGIIGSAFMVNFSQIDDDMRCDICQKTIFAAIRSNDHEAIALILNFIAALDTRGLRFRLASQIAELVNQYTNELRDKMPSAIDANLILLNQTVGELCLANLPQGAAPDSACRMLIPYYFWSGNTKRALELNRMIQKPTQADANQLTILLIEEGLFEEALPHLRKMETDMPDKLTDAFYMQLGMAEDKCGHQAEAAKAFYKALELNPKHSSAANYLGYTLLINGGDLKEAERLLEIAYGEEPNNSAIMDSVAWLRFKQGRYAEALRIMASVVQSVGSPRLSEEENAELREHLLAILQSLGLDYLASYYN